MTTGSLHLGDRTGEFFYEDALYAPISSCTESHLLYVLLADSMQVYDRLHSHAPCVCETGRLQLQSALWHAHLVLFLCLLHKLRVIHACKADHVFALAPAELIVSKEVDGECAFLFQSHEFAAHVFWGHHLRREQSHSASAAMALLGKVFASSAFSPALATMDSLRCEQRRGRQHSMLRSCCSAGHQSQTSRCIRGRFTGREERV